MTDTWGISHGTWQMISIILLGLFIWYLATNYLSLGFLFKEGFSTGMDNGDTSNTISSSITPKSSIGASSETKETETRTNTEDIKNIVALDKYRTFYDNILVNTHDSLGYLAVQQIVDMPTIDPNDPTSKTRLIQYLQDMNTVCDAHKNVNSILGWMDKQ